MDLRAYEVVDLEDYDSSIVQTQPLTKLHGNPSTTSSSIHYYEITTNNPESFRAGLHAQDRDTRFLDYSTPIDFPLNTLLIR